MDRVKLIRAMEKCSAVKRAGGVGPVEDYAYGVPANFALSTIPGLGQAVAPAKGIAYLAGLASKPDNSQKGAGPAFIPGVSDYRLGNRIKTQVVRELEQIKKDKKNEGARPVAHAVAEHLGKGTSALLATLIGGAIGAKIPVAPVVHKSLLEANAGKLRIGSDEAFDSALEKLREAENSAPINQRIRNIKYGLISGLGVAGISALAALIAAAIKRRRTEEEQIKSDKGSVLKKYLLPGVAQYDYLKRLGRSQGERDEAEGKSEKKASATWDQIREQIGNYAKNAKSWYADQDAVTKALLSTGGGAIGGAAISKLFGGEAGRGAALGALAGGASRIDWSSLLKALEEANSDGQ